MNTLPAHSWTPFVWHQGTVWETERPGLPDASGRFGIIRLGDRSRGKQVFPHEVRDCTEDECAAARWWRDNLHKHPEGPKDGRGVPYTLQRVQDAAADHVAYGWTRRPGGWTGEPWTPELLKAYNDEYDRLIGKPVPA
jgi:hypothetical protein